MIRPLRFAMWSMLLWFTSVFKFSSAPQKRAVNFWKFLGFSKCYTNVSYLAIKYSRHFTYGFMSNFLKGLWHTCTIILYGNWKKNLGRMFVFIFLLLTTLFGRTAKFDSKLASTVTFFFETWVCNVWSCFWLKAIVMLLTLVINGNQFHTEG